MAPWISHIHTPTCISFILPGSTEPQMPQVLAIFLLLRDSVPSEPPPAMWASPFPRPVFPSWHLGDRMTSLSGGSFTACSTLHYELFIHISSPGVSTLLQDTFSLAPNFPCLPTSMDVTASTPMALGPPALTPMTPNIPTPQAPSPCNTSHLRQPVSLPLSSWA